MVRKNMSYHPNQVFCVNLKRREDRKKTMTNLFEEHKIPYSFFDAVDGSKVKPTPNICELFQGNDFHSRVGEIGCALSHKYIWEKIVAQNDYESFLVFEDDIEFHQEAKKYLEEIENILSHLDYDLCYISYHPWGNVRQEHLPPIEINSEGHIRYQSDLNIKIKLLNKDHYVGGTFAYYVSKQGAQKLLDYIDKNGIKHGIDYVMKICEPLIKYECSPFVVYSEWVENMGSGVDSDIQKTFKYLDIYSDENFEFHRGMDVGDNDLFCTGKRPVPELKQIALSNPEVKCFNTLGFFKHTVGNLGVSHFLGKEDGVFILREKSEKNCRIKILDENIKFLCNTILENNNFKNIDFITDDSNENIDLYFAYDVLPDISSIPYERVIFFYQNDNKETTKKNSRLLIKKFYEQNDLLQKDVFSEIHLLLFDDWKISNHPVRSQLITKKINSNRKTRIKMLCNWTSSEQLCKDWSHMSFDGFGEWGNIQITSDSKNIDFYVIINFPPQNEYYDPNRTIVFRMEPWCGENYQSWGAKTWGDWAKPNPENFLQVRTHNNFINNCFWQLSWTYQDFINKPIVKDQTKENIISSICSSKYFDPGHIFRIDFLKYIEKKNDPDVQIHVYNEDNEHNFKGYMGKADPHKDKDKGIMPYKYYFMAENNSEKNFITEKIWESLLTETLCFYWGCPNISEHIHPDAYVVLPFPDYEASYQIVKKAIKEDWYSQRLGIIRKEKERALNYFNFFPTVERVLFDEFKFSKHPNNLEIEKKRTIKKDD